MVEEKYQYNLYEVVKVVTDDWFDYNTYAVITAPNLEFESVLVIGYKNGEPDEELSCSEEFERVPQTGEILDEAKYLLDWIALR